jgi:hypothetical protein
MPKKFEAIIKGQENIDGAIGAVLMDVWFTPDAVRLFFTKTPDVRSTAFSIEMKVKRNEPQPFHVVKIDKQGCFPLSIPQQVIDHFDQFGCYERG